MKKSILFNSFIAAWLIAGYFYQNALESAHYFLIVINTIELILLLGSKEAHKKITAQSTISFIIYRLINILFLAAYIYYGWVILATIVAIIIFMCISIRAQKDNEK